jgi:hypothetical protein
MGCRLTSFGVLGIGNSESSIGDDFKGLTRATGFYRDKHAQESEKLGLWERLNRASRHSQGSSKAGWQHEPVSHMYRLAHTKRGNAAQCLTSTDVIPITRGPSPPSFGR